MGSLDHQCRDLVPVLHIQQHLHQCCCPSLGQLKSENKAIPSVNISGKKKVGKTSYRLWGSYSPPSGIFFFLSWLSWEPLSLIPRIPRPSWMKFGFGSSHTSVAFSLKQELWVWLEKEMRRRVKLTKRIHLL